MSEREVQLTSEERRTLFFDESKRPRSADEVAERVEQLIAARMERVPTVEIDAALGEPTTCRVSIGGGLVFNGVDLGTLAQAEKNGSARLADAEARAEAAKLLHQRVPADSPFNREGRDVCSTCMDGIHPADWPCQTLYALRGDS